MNKDLAQAHIGTLTEWADLYQRDDVRRARMVSILLRRAASQIGVIYGVSAPPAPEDDAVEEAVSSPKADEDHG